MRPDTCRSFCVEVGTETSGSRDELHEAQKLGAIPFSHHDDGVCFVWTFAEDTDRQPVLHAMPKQGEVIGGRNLPAGRGLLLSLGDDLGRQVLQQRSQRRVLEQLGDGRLAGPLGMGAQALELPVERQFAPGMYRASGGAGEGATAWPSARCDVSSDTAAAPIRTSRTDQAAQPSGGDGQTIDETPHGISSRQSRNRRGSRQKHLSSQGTYRG